MGLSKIIFGEYRIDLTSDTVTADKLLEGITAHNAEGEIITGTCTFDADTQDATVTASEILSPKTAYARGVKLTGTMKNNASVDGQISTKEEQYNVAEGYHDGGGKVGIAAAEQAKLIPSNIRDGVTILGVTGSMSGEEGVKAQAKTITPRIAAQEVLPDNGFNYLSQVTVEGIPYTIADNSAGGKTLTIG